MRQYFWILCIGIRLSICGEQAISMYGYVDQTKGHMSDACEKALEERMQRRRQPPAFYPGNGHPTDFKGCNFTCRMQSGPTTIEQHVNLTDGVPCGPKGEKCKDGLCVGGKSPELKNCADLVPRSPYE
uniref:Putative secreted salivary gland peptide n=1 Tax=Ixodes scapularis TaxID=6945 RepID=Q5Q999_IXOSC|nr:putative secreted salivary gland peptide [Ixodes scapularis]